MKKILLIAITLSLPMILFAQVTLTAYYEKGELIVDTNDPVNRMVNYSKTKYKFEGDDTGEYYSWYILKSKVTVKTYRMSELPVVLVRDGAIFRSKDGYEVRIFPANAAGHLFMGVDYEDNFSLFVDEAQTAAHQHYYVISGLLKNFNSSDGFFFEDPLEVENGNIKLYRTPSEVGYGCDVKGDLRYRAHKMGFIEEKWTPPEEYGYEKSAYNANGDLLTDLQVITIIPEYLSIAWIEEEDALYINGTLYYRQTKNDSTKEKAAKKQPKPIDIREMPTKDKTLEVILNENDFSDVTAKIYKNGKFLQKVTKLEVSPMVSDVRFVDANFDGYTDIYIGVGGSRSANELLIWDNDTRRFKRFKGEDEDWQGFRIDPSTKSIYTGGSTSGWTFEFYRYTWKKNKLCLEESMFIANAAHQDVDGKIEEWIPAEEIFKQEGVVARYTLKDKNDHLIIATNELSLLPGKWPDVLEWNKGNY